MLRNKIIAAFGAVLVYAGPTHAHVISIGHGSIVVHPDRLRFELKVVAEDFRHYYGPGVTLTIETIEQAAASHANQLLERVAIRDAEGHRLSGRLVSRIMDPAEDAKMEGGRLRSRRVNYVFEYPLKNPPRYLSFQQTVGDGSVAMPAQLYLDVRSAGAGGVKIVRLTSGGNVETLRFNWPDNDGARPSLVGPIEELKTVQAHIDVGDDEVRVTTVVPLPVLETFLAVERADRDFLEASEQQAAIPGLLVFFSDRNPLWINGRPADVSDTKLGFLAVDSSNADIPLRRLGAWTTRVQVIQSYRLNSRPGVVELRWNLFNPAVLEVQTVITCAGQKSTHRISTYEPILRWNAPATGK